jgi:hypothetical protein
VPAAIRTLRTAAIVRLKAVVTLVEGRVFTGAVDQNEALPYLLIGSYNESASDHYGGPGSDSGFDIRGVVRAFEGDSPMLAIWEQVHEALQYSPLTLSGHQAITGEVRYLTDYRDPSDPTVRHFVARYEAITAVVAA